jgi:hypothetical protein
VTTSNLATKGGFSLPGEAGYEDLAWQLAERWGADAIRDSDGTVLSDEILSAGFDIYSTICLVRADNEWFALYCSLLISPQAAISGRSIFRLAFTESYRATHLGAFGQPGFRATWPMEGRFSRFSQSWVRSGYCDLTNIFYCSIMATSVRQYRTAQKATPLEMHCHLQTKASRSPSMASTTCRTIRPLQRKDCSLGPDGEES